MRTRGTATTVATTLACIPGQAKPKINYTGPKPPFDTLEGFDKYSFLKTPRWKDNAMEVGPLARLLVSYAAGQRM